MKTLLKSILFLAVLAVPVVGSQAHFGCCGWPPPPPHPPITDQAPNAGGNPIPQK